MEIDSVETNNIGKPPKAFISYSWDSDEHREWVVNFAARLRSEGIEVILDQWYVAPGDQLTEFMEREIRENDFVLIVCTPRYKERSDGRIGGVGYEGDILTAEALTARNHKKFIPILRSGEWSDAAPSWLIGRYYIDIRGEKYSEKNYTDLLDTLLNRRPQAPPVNVNVSQARTFLQALPSVGSTSATSAELTNVTYPATTLQGRFRLFDLHEDQSVLQLGQGRAAGLFLLDKKLILICTTIGARLFDFTTGSILWEITCPSLKSDLNRSASMLALASPDEIYLWDLHDGHLAWRVNDSRGQVWLLFKMSAMVRYIS